MRLFDKDPDELSGASLIGFEGYVPDPRELESRERYRRYCEVAGIPPKGGRSGHLAWGIAHGCNPWVVEVTMTVEHWPSKQRPQTVCRMALFEGSHSEPAHRNTLYLKGIVETPSESEEFRKELKKWLWCKVAGALDYESPLPR